MEFTENAVTTLEARYLLRDENGNLTERPNQLLWRVANAIGAVEEHTELANHWAVKFYGLMRNGDFFPNTPTLMNAGLERGQLSACYVLPIEDSIEGIFGTLKDAAKIHQSGGGTGFDFSRLRPEGTQVDSKQGVASGPISFASVYNQSTEIMKQGGKRKGANMMNLRVDHPNILQFIDMKMTPGVMENFNVSVTITNEFMEALERDSTYNLRHPVTGVVGELSARDVWDRIARNAHTSAEPGIIFIDRVNERSPYWEAIEATNPCGEQPLPPYGSCNLGSINLANFVEDGRIAYGRLEEVVHHAVRFLDNVIDANVYPTKELRDHALRYRNIGLGVMGWADMLIKLKIPYNSMEAVLLGEEIQRFINQQAHVYSTQLAQEKGLPSAAPFKSFFDYSSGSRRNATLTTVAPTGSLCIFADCSSGIEPNFAFILTKHILDRIMDVLHPLYEKAMNNGGVDKSIFIESHDVQPEYHVLMQAAFQKHCDSGISKTANLPAGATVADIKDIYWLAWTSGCKGVTVYRDGSREGVLHKVEEKQEEGCCDAPNIVKESGCETCKNCGTSKCLIA